MGDDEHILNDKWDLYYHLPTDPNWDIRSYKIIMKDINSCESVIALNNNLKSGSVKNCMLFLMRSCITPRWEDPQNRNGGCFCYKIHNKTVYPSWNLLFKYIVTETLSDNKTVNENINGITISPKKNFCIIKIWMKTTEYQDSSVFKTFVDERSQGCLFRKHEPEY
jgi:hypothetical protein